MVGCEMGGIDNEYEKDVEERTEIPGTSAGDVKGG